EYVEFMTARRKDLQDAIDLADPEPDERALVLRGRLRYFFPLDGTARGDLEAALVLEPRDVEALVLRALLGAREREDPLIWMRRALDADERATFLVARHFQIFKGDVPELAFAADLGRRHSRRGDAESAYRA